MQLNRLGDLLIPTAGMLFAVTYYALTYDLPAESRVFPHFAVVVILAFGSILLAQTFLGRAMLDRGEPPSHGGRSRVPLLYGLTAGFVALFWLVDFLVASLVFLFVAQVLLGQPKIKSALIAAGVTAGFYGIFHTLLRVQL